MAGNIKLNAPSGGSVTLNAVDTASNFNMQVPAAAGVLINATSATGAANCLSARLHNALLLL